MRMNETMFMGRATDCFNILSHHHDHHQHQQQQDRKNSFVSTQTCDFNHLLFVSFHSFSASNFYYFLHETWYAYETMCCWFRVENIRQYSSMTFAATVLLTLRSFYLFHLLYRREGRIIINIYQLKYTVNNANTVVCCDALTVSDVLTHSSAWNVNDRCVIDYISIRQHVWRWQRRANESEQRRSKRNLNDEWQCVESGFE